MGENLINVNEIVSIDGDEVMTTSYQVAKFFGRLHKNVIQAIEKLECSEKFRGLNFQLCFENSALQNGKANKFYRMTKNGFMFLVMGFTGSKAALLKEAYINAFDVMYNWILKGREEVLRQKAVIEARRIEQKAIASEGGRTLNSWKYIKRNLDAEEERLNMLCAQPDLFIAA